MSELTRRSLLKGLTVAPLVGSIAPANAEAFWWLFDRPREVSVENLHTGEKACNVCFYENGTFNDDAMQEISRVMRDWRNNKVHPIDPNLVKQMTVLAAKLDTQPYFQIVSGYRSPETNEMLRKNTDGVAEFSYHLLGKAADIRVPSRDIERVRDAALSMGQGGVGYYRASQFVHVDTGKFRTWS